MNDKIVVIHQPDFLPYIGFFQRLVNADIYLVFDNVQFVRGSRTQTSRDKIKTRQGEQWINVGIIKPPYKCKINEVLLRQDEEWRKRDLNLIYENYKSAPFFSEIFPYVQELFEFKCEKMFEFNMKSILILKKLFGIDDVEIRYASDFDVEGKSNELIINLVKANGCKKYLSGLGAKNYYNPELYKEAGIEVIWQQFSHPIYQQQFGEFIPYLSSIDLLFNCGVEQSRKILKNI